MHWILVRGVPPRKRLSFAAATGAAEVSQLRIESLRRRGAPVGGLQARRAVPVAVRAGNDADESRVIATLSLAPNSCPFHTPSRVEVTPAPASPLIDALPICPPAMQDGYPDANPSDAIIANASLLVSNPVVPLSNTDSESEAPRLPSELTAQLAPLVVVPSESAAPPAPLVVVQSESAAPPAPLVVVPSESAAPRYPAASAVLHSTSISLDSLPLRATHVTTLVVPHVAADFNPWRLNPSAQRR